MTPDQWCSRVDDLLGGAPRDEGGLSEKPRVVVVGAYNTAKTTLLRRLLVDEGLPVPAWARVSDREETSVIGTVELPWCTVIDTPGLEALSRWHSDESRRALEDADAVLLLTTSNLFSTDDRRARDGEPYLRAVDVLSGRVFLDGGMAYPREAFAVLVTRFDEAALDPSDFPDEYDESRHRKLGELFALVREHAPAAADSCHTSVIAADPFGRTRNRTAVRADFDAYRSWDGMDEVVGWLRSISSRGAELSQWRKVRSRAARLTDSARSLTVKLDDARVNVSKAEAGAREATLLVGRCDREKTSAGARLAAAVDSAVYAAPGPGDPHFQRELQALLERELTLWADATRAALGSLADESQDALQGIEVTSASVASQQILTGASRPSAWREHGESLRRRLDLVRRGLILLTVDDAGQPTVRDPGGPGRWFGVSTSRAEEVDALLTAASALLGLVEEADEQRAQERSYQRDRVQRQTAVVARSMFTSDSCAGWEAMFDELSKAAQGTLEVSRDTQRMAQDREQGLVHSLERMQELLKACPQPAA